MAETSFIDSTHNILNWMAGRIAWSHSAPFSNTMVILKFHNDVTYVKPEKLQSDSDTPQAIWHKTQTAQHITTRSIQNPFSTVQLLQEYRLPEKPQIQNIC